MDPLLSTKVLFLAANPIGTVILATNNEYDRIKSVLQTTPKRESIKLDINHTVSSKNVQSLLLQHSPNIVHFSGHGSEEGAILFENEAGVREEVKPGVLAELFRVINKDKIIRCVLLNACYSSRQAKSIVNHVDSFTL